MLFQNRTDAGKKIASRLLPYKKTNPLIMALPLGGVLVAREVAEVLGAPLDVVVARKLAPPGHPELSIGAIAEERVRVVDEVAVRLLNISKETLAQIEAEQQAELSRCLHLYRNTTSLSCVKGRTVIVVDDGLTTGLTARAALQAVAKHHPKDLVLAVPVSGPERAAAMLNWVEDFVCYAVPPNFVYVSDWYMDFTPCQDADVIKALKEAGHQSSRRLEYLPPSGVTSKGSVLRFETAAGTLEAELEFPKSRARGIILLAHGSGSHRNSPRNQAVASALIKENFAVLRMDLLAAGEATEEEKTLHFRFNIGLLSERTAIVTRWIKSHEATKHLPLGYFGASTGAAALLLTTARLPRGSVAAIVSRGGRPDLVEPILPKVRAPLLFLVGENDREVLEHNQRVFEQIGSSDKKLTVVKGAGHLFEELGKTEEVSRISADWFKAKLRIR